MGRNEKVRIQRTNGGTMKKLMPRSSLNRPKHTNSFYSVISYLIKESYISKDSKDIPIDFINSEAIKIREKRSSLPSDMRKIIVDLYMENMASEITSKGDSK